MDMDIIIHGIQCALLNLLNQIACNLIQDPLLEQYLSTLSDIEKIDTLWAFLIVWILTQGALIPNIFQLKAPLTTLQQ